MRTTCAGGVAVSLLAGVSLVGCGNGEGPVANADSCGGDTPVIAFDHETTDPDRGIGGGTPEVSVMTADGDIVLVTGSWVANAAAFSPDGDRLVVVKADGDYESAGPQATALWVLRADGSDRRELTSGRVHDEAPDWSPDGASIVFVRGAGDANGYTRSIQTISAQGGEPTELLRVRDDRLEEPVWSPDGGRIAFARSTYTLDGFTSSVWAMNADGTGAQPLAVDLARVTSIDWHPHGTSLLVDTGDETHLIDADTGRAQTIGAGTAQSTWAPDGRSAYYFRDLGTGDLRNDWNIVEGRIDDASLVDERTVLAERELSDSSLADVGLHPGYSFAVGPCA